MTPRYFYSTEHAAAALHLSKRHFVRVAFNAHEEPMIFSGPFHQKFMWGAPTLARLRANYRPSLKWAKRKPPTETQA